MIIFSKFWRQLVRSKRYREEFVAAQVKLAIPFQIRLLMQQHELNQEQLAKRAGLTQGAVSRAANPQYGNLTLNTIIRIAAGFDVGFIGQFVPFSEMERWYERFSEQNLGAASFVDECRELAKGRPTDGDQIKLRMAKAEIDRIETSSATEGLSRDDVTTDDGGPIHNNGALELSVMNG